MRKTVLVVGGAGFIGGSIVAALRAAGHRVFAGVRPSRALADGERALDIVHADDASFAAALRDVDVVVNASGILRPTRAQGFDAVHVDGPLRLARHCVDAGVPRFVQISALGEPADGAFIASKHRFDAALQALPIQAVVLRPSVVYSPGGSYGGTSLLRALAGFPGFQWLPGDGRWLLSPVAMEDLAHCVVAAVEGEATGVFEVGSPQPIPLRGYQRQWRQWLRVRGTRVLQVPEWLVALQVRLWERLGSGPVGMTMWRMLRRGNVVAVDAAQRLQQAFGVRVRPLSEVLAAHASQVQDRWQAQLYFLGPALRAAVIALWLLSAWAGLATAPETVRTLVSGTPLAELHPVLLARAGGWLDLLLGLWLATPFRPRPAVALMAASVLAYTLVFGIAMPAAWLDPLGGLAKNLVVLPALAALWVLLDRR